MKTEVERFEDTPTITFLLEEGEHRSYLWHTVRRAHVASSMGKGVDLGHDACYIEEEETMVGERVSGACW